MPDRPVLFGKTRAIAGMIHLPALPGTPGNRLTVPEIVEHSRKEAAVYAQAGVDAVLVENMHDRPYLKGKTGPEIVAAMTAAACAIRREFSGPCGLQVLAGANEEALGIALAAEFDFIRAEGFVFAHVADEGLVEGCAGPLLRARKAWGAEHIKVFTDIKKKHSSHAITADVSLGETAKAAEFFGSDGIIVSGASTGDPVSLTDLEEAASSTSLPVLAGSGTTDQNIESMFRHAGAVIVGSWIKEKGDWTRPIDPARVASLVRIARGSAA